MPNEPFYLTVADLIAIHDELTARTGSPHAPLRDPALIESAFARPRMAAHYENADIVRQSVLLAVGISQAQAFVDGNKRTALAAANVFLDLNGFVFVDDPIEFAQQFEEIAARRGTLDAATDQFESWLRMRVQAPPRAS